MATNIFDNDRLYFLGDAELSVFGTREKLAQWRYHNRGPAYMSIGRRIAYHGTDLNAYLHAQRCEPNAGGAK